ncbi:MAG: competence/damage-inducible protein A [Flavobacteriaceae bacterium]|nr:competence/damage-inducible protein A [Flavobacteriaceae bacterium]
MKAEIITIGDEILIGQIVDSNSAFIANQLNDIGIEVVQITSISDRKEAITTAMRQAQSRSSLVLLTGGLGPTKDDITKHTFCEYFADELVLNETVLQHIEVLFSKYVSTPINDLNRAQALLPSKATLIENRFGTAAGMWMENEHAVFISMPGVPYEMKEMVSNQVIPKLQTTFKRPAILHKTVMTYGLGESAIAERIEDWENSLPSHVKLAYLPNLGRVRLRLSAKGSSKKILESEIDQLIESLHPLIGDIIVGLDTGSAIESEIGALLTKKKQNLATAESCTGGRIASRITAISGASVYFRGSVVSYATSLKKSLLGVSESSIKKHSVVSEAVVQEMALGAQQQLQVDYAIATTGNAGPNKGESEEEIGTVFIAIASPSGVAVEKFTFGLHREKTLQKTVNKALEMLRIEILKNP